MGKEILSIKQAVFLMMAVMGAEAILTSGYHMRETGALLSMIISVAVMFPIVYILSYILSKNPEKDVFDISHTVFGKIIGKLFIIIIILYSFLSCFQVMKRGNLSVYVQSFVDTPLVVPTIFLSIVIFIFLSKKGGIETIGRAASIYMPLVIIEFIMVYIYLFEYTDINFLKPFVAEPMSNVVKGAGFNIAFIFGDLFLILGVLIDPTKKRNHLKAFLIALTLSGGLYIINTAYIDAVLSPAVSSIVRYPTYTMISIISVGDFITRIEVLIDAVLVVALLFRIMLPIYIGTKGISKLVGAKDYKKFVLPFLVIIIFLTVNIQMSTNDVKDISDQYYWIFLIFQIGIPIILGIFVTINQLFKKQKN